ncbi:MAG: 2'-5' RNA ligase family protein [Dehalococcoidales bacterium]
MVSFLIEFRMHGYAKEFAKEMIYSVAKEFKVKGVTKKRVVPHICLYGPGRTDNIRKVVSAVEKVGRNYRLVPFNIIGFGYFDTPKKVIYLNISPSQQLEELRWKLSQELRKVSISQSRDSRKNHAFHATVAFRDIDLKFNRIWHYLENKKQPNINQHLLRITIIGAHRKIVCEYDLVLKKLLNRREALSKRLWRKTINKLREIQGLQPERQPSTKNWLQKLLNWLNQ